ncbi:MAG: flagellar assembly protein H [Vulcanimicrobiota bacterium]
MDHDGLFKKLLTTFFYEFLELFFDDLTALVDRSQQPEFLDKETYKESTRTRDLVVRLRLLDGDAFFIIHVEHEAQSTRDFPARFFRYFTTLWDRYHLPIYPIAVFSFPGQKLQPQSYSMEFHDLTVLEFRYRTVQLNRLNWSQFVDKPNPVASALMARMKIRKRERPIVRLQCLRLLATLRLDKEKSGLISHFVSSYLRLNSQEMRVYEENLEAIPVQERQVVVQYTNEWIEQGIERGIEQGRREGSEKASRRGLKCLLELKFAQAAAPLVARLPELGLEILERLQDALESGADLQQLEKLVP